MKWRLMLLPVVLIGLCAGMRMYGGTLQSKGHGMEITSAPFGKTSSGQAAVLYTLKNPVGMKVTITNYGATVTGLWVPDRLGKLKDVVLGFNTLGEYIHHSPYFGCIVGRYANRIARGMFTLDGKEYTLAKNDHQNHLHGGNKGFDKVLWKAEPVKTTDSVGVKLTYHSPNGEEEYPGNLTMNVWYWLNNRNELNIVYEGTSDAPTIVNCSHHGYFNLGNAPTILDHEVMISADRFTPVDSGLIPTGEMRPVEGGPMDFRTYHTIGSRISQVSGGYDHNFVLNHSGDELMTAAIVREPVSGRQMEVLTTEPGLQFYTGNFLDGTLKGKTGAKIMKNGGFCMEAQHFPDSPNHPEFPSVVIRPGDVYRQTTVYKFSVIQK